MHSWQPVHLCYNVQHSDHVVELVIAAPHSILCPESAVPKFSPPATVPCIIQCGEVSVTQWEGVVWPACSLPAGRAWVGICPAGHHGTRTVVTAAPAGGDRPHNKIYSSSPSILVFTKSFCGSSDNVWWFGLDHQIFFIKSSDISF